MQQLAPRLEEQPTKENDFNHIILTDDETKEALRAAREQKHYLQRKIEYLNGLNQPKQVKTFTVEELRVIIRNSKLADGKKFIVDKDNQNEVDLLCLYFAGDIRFEATEDFSLSKGILLMGGLGVGKTHLMSFFTQNQKQSYKMVSCRQVENQWLEAGKVKDDPVDVIAKYTTAQPIAVNSSPFGHKEIGVCFDDLGTESIPSKRFGEEKNVMAEIIMGRYDNRMNEKTHFTTNLDPDGIQKLYGDRVRDRLREMCNVIMFDDNAKSRRK
jgi:DNA replication protein DnaC